ncbi:MAG: competence/damage-inducible protein A [Bacteroidia bacterium]|nr:competence/damage-inducible protein A [Bacteroidia bacterium]
MRAEIITIGDEILIGQIIDTNSSWLGQELSKLGIQVVHRTSVSDNKLAIINALNSAKTRADTIIITGGLGPTKDDITKSTLTDYFNTELVLNAEVLEWVTSIFKRRNLPMVDSNNAQAMLPANCEVLFNKSGTAPGMWFDDDGKVFISLPGVPFEMKDVFTDQCIPRLQKRFSLPVLIHRNILTCGIGESFLAEKIEALETDLPPHIKLAYLPSIGTVRLRFSGTHTHYATLKTEIDIIVNKLYEIIGEYVYGEELDTLQLVVGSLLHSINKTVATAESCTGGYVSHLLTSVSGSSNYYMGSIISYANQIKIDELNINPEILKTFGAVSQECVTQMAQHVKQKLNTNYAIATSGIAGPSGGTIEKPVGTVWVAVSGPNNTVAKQFNMGDNRERTIERTSVQGLDMLRKMLLEDKK